MRSISSSSEWRSPSGVVTWMSRSASSTPNEKAAARLPPPENVSTTNSLSELPSTPGASTGAVSGTTASSGCSRAGMVPQAVKTQVEMASAILCARVLVMHRSIRCERSGSSCDAVHVRPQNLHEHTVVRRRAKAELRVQAMSVAGSQHGPARGGQRGMRHHRSHEELAEPLAAMLFEHVDIAQIRERGVIGDDARQ